MLVQVPDVLTGEQVAAARQALDGAEWVDGRITAGHQSALSKDNMQLMEDDSAARQIGEVILRALGRSPLFISAALPSKVFPPLFNRYRGGQSFGVHVDNAVRQVARTMERLRTDLSATLFLAQTDEYDGGELVIEDTYGLHEVKLPAGHMILYPASSLHRVQPVTRGARLAAFFWIQSMVREDHRRRMLYGLDASIQRLTAELPRSNASVLDLTALYHNLLREWSDV